MPGYSRYIEPFVGGGALMYLSAVPGSVAGDVYSPLIKLWRLLKASPEIVLHNYRTQWTELKKELDDLNLNDLPQGMLLPRYFYFVRDRFNQNQDPLDLNFILRTCVNGIVRFNSSGQFNNSFHLSRRGMEPDRFERVVAAWAPVLRDVEFVCHDYAETTSIATEHDFVYLDPPYARNTDRYVADLELARFFDCLELMNRRRVKWALSFDGRRGSVGMFHEVPKSLFKRHVVIASGNSAVKRVLNGPVELVEESLYLNY
jgi:DNA adenine methylase